MRKRLIPAVLLSALTALAAVPAAAQTSPPTAAPGTGFVPGGPSAALVSSTAPVDSAIAKAACGTKILPSKSGGITCAGIAGYPGGKCKEPSDITGAVPTTDGRLLVSYTSIGCESHSNNFGGTMVLDRTGNGWRRTAIVPGVDSSRCVAIPGSPQLACLSGYSGTGSASTAVMIIDANAPDLANAAAFAWEVSSGASDERDACSGADAVERIESGVYQGRPALRLSLVRAAKMPPQSACDALDTDNPTAEKKVAAWLRANPGDRTVKGWAIVAADGDKLVPMAASDEAFLRMLRN